MSIYWYSLENLTLPLLFFGMFFALLQFSIGGESSSQIEGRKRAMIKRIASELTIIWLILASILALGIFVKTVMTAVGWVAYHIGRPLFGQIVPPIDDKLGIGCIVFLCIFIIIYIGRLVRFINHRKAKTMLKVNEVVKCENNQD